MLEATLTEYRDDDDNLFYLLNVEYEELTFSIPLTMYDLTILESGLDGCLYQGVTSLALEFCTITSNERRQRVSLRFINNVPILTFNLQKTYAINLLHDIRKMLE